MHFQVPAIDRLVATAQNGAEIVRYGGLRTGSQHSPSQIVETSPMYRLRRYFADDLNGGPPVVLIPPMMVAARVYDVGGESGGVATLHRAGLDPWVVDFGSPDEVEGGNERTLTDHIVAVSDIVDLVGSITGRKVHLSGYSQGGLFAYQAAAFRRSEGLASVITFGSPVDILSSLPVLGVPASPYVVVPAAEYLADNVFERLSINGWVAKTGFQLLDPINTARQRIDFLRRLHDREALLPREDQRRFIEKDGWVGWSGPAIAEFLRQVVVHNRMVTGGMVINGQLITLSEISVPIFGVIGGHDNIGQPAAVRGIRRAAPDADIWEFTIPAGHYGLVVGSQASEKTWPEVGAWVNWQEGQGERPAHIRPMLNSDEVDPGQISTSARLLQSSSMALGTGIEVGRDALGLAGTMARTSQAVLRESIRTVPRMVRLGQIQPGTTMSLGKLMAENAKNHPHRELFLFEDRVLTNLEVDRRINNVVAGLIESGIRPGQHVGLMMDSRPSALVAVAALSRLGAVVVMLSPEGDVAEAMASSETNVIVTDPPNLTHCQGHSERILVLGGGDSRVIDQADGKTIVDMEKIDPERVELPAWYRPNSGLAGDLAYILFTSNGGQLERWPISNHRWALSAFGAATAAAITNKDTVYCLTPLHHASGLLTTLGATVVGGARIALPKRLDMETALEELPRYGITVVSYTWSMLDMYRGLKELALRRSHGTYRHSIRLLMGSGIPAGTWENHLKAWPETRILEFFATADGSAILANVSGDKIGSVGRPLPETVVRLAAYDLEKDSFITDEKGFVREARVGEPGLLLAKSRQRMELSATVHRGVFAARDRWENTRHMFTRDDEGDYWMLGNVASIIRSADGLVYPQPILTALSRASWVRHVAVYGVGEPGRAVAIAAVELTDAAQPPTVSQIRLALAELPAGQRPHLIRVVPKMPMSSAYRPRVSRETIAEGIPAPARGIWVRHSNGGYRRYAAAAAAELRAGHPTGVSSVLATVDTQ